jgi:hypothetical protein
VPPAELTVGDAFPEDGAGRDRDDDEGSGVQGLLG